MILIRASSEDHRNTLVSSATTMLISIYMSGRGGVDSAAKERAISSARSSAENLSSDSASFSLLISDSIFLNVSTAGQY